MDKEPRPQYDANADKDVFLLMIEKGRDILRDDHMAVLYALYDESTKGEAAAHLGISVAMLEKKVQDIVTLMTAPPKTERLTKYGKPYLRHLGRRAYTSILAEYSDMEDEERQIIEAAARSKNQVIAAQSLGMSLNVYTKRYRQIRKQHGF